MDRDRDSAAPPDERRRAYERELLSTFAAIATTAMGRRAPELSDADRDGEFRAQQLFFAALAEFKTQVNDALRSTSLRQDALKDLLAGLDDAAPDPAAWDEAVFDARRGY
jgi:hypothetical protein